MSYKEVLAAFASAQTAAQYQGAKRLAGRLSIPAQYQVVDSIIACRRRLVEVGVL